MPTEHMELEPQKHSKRGTFSPGRQKQRLMALNLAKGKGPWELRFLATSGCIDMLEWLKMNSWSGAKAAVMQLAADGIL